MCHLFVATVASTCKFPFWSNLKIDIKIEYDITIPEIINSNTHVNRFCGDGPSEDIVYYGNGLVLHFHTDDSYTFGGFKITYSVEAEGWSHQPQCKLLQ